MFTATFRIVNGVLNAAEIINAPHTPRAIMETADIIARISKMGEISAIGETLCRGVHGIICKGWLHDAGEYRRCPVQIGGELLDWIFIQDDMSKLHPYIVSPTFQEGIDDLGRWYSAFQRIHPFSDGNGRVGGAIIAGVSLAMFDCLLVPDGDT